MSKVTVELSFKLAQCAVAPLAPRGWRRSVTRSCTSWGVAGQAVHRERHRKVEQHPQGANALGGDPTEPVVTAGVEAPTPKNLSDFYVSLLANHR